MPHKPDGYTSLSPYLIVADAEEVLRFGEAAFGATRLRVIRRDDGEIMHAELRIDDTVLMIGQMAGGPEAHLHLYVAEPEAVMDRAVAAGAEVIQPLKDQGDGDLRGGVRDGQGTTWWIACQLDQTDA